MKKLKISSEGVNHSSIDLGNLDELMDYSYMHPKRQQEVKGNEEIFTKLMNDDKMMEVAAQQVAKDVYNRVRK